MRVLLFGAGGQVGSAFAQCAGEQHEVIVPPRQLADFLKPEQVGALVAHSAAEVVVNCAAYTAVDQAESEPERAALVNVETPAAVARAVADAGGWLVHFSTDYVFDGREKRPYREDDPVSPLGVYGLTKYQGEQAVRRTLTRHLILRTSWVYSHSGHNFLRTMLKLGAEKDRLGIVADQIGCPTYAPDLAAACLQLVDKLGAGGAESVAGTYHLSGADQASWYEFAGAIFDTREIDTVVDPIATRDYPTAAPRPAWSVLDNTAVQNRFGVRVPGYHDALPRCFAAMV